MPNIKLKLQYEGTDYSGWQIQPKDRTIEGVLTEAIGKILQRDVKVIGASRTDAGVHARGQVANFIVDRDVNLITLKRGLNALLPPDIAVQDALEVSPEFHSRYNAKSKEYQYYIWNRDYKSTFYHRYSWHYHPPLDTAEMNKAATLLVGEKDFSSFRGAGCDSPSSIRRIDSVDIKKDSGFIIFAIKGSGFLKHMVRNIVGTLVQIGEGRIKTEKIIEILESRDRKLAGPTAEAKGLVLVKIKY